MSEIYKSEIEWRSDVGQAPKNRRVFLIATPMVSNEANVAPEIVVGHWHGQRGAWVIADTAGESRRDPRIELKPMFWAELGTLPFGIILRRLDLRDFNG